MTAPSKTKKELFEENNLLKQRIKELEKSDAAREKVKEALRKSEQKVRAIFDHSFQFIGMLTHEGTLVEANKTAMQFTGINEQDCLGKPFWNTPWWTHSADMQDKLHGAFIEALKGDIMQFEVTHPAADGNIHIVDFSLKPVKDELGKIIFLIAEGRDITERKQIENALREQEEKYRAFFNTSRDCVFITSVDGRWLDLNNAAVQLFGYGSREELINVQIKDLYVNPDQRKEHLQLINEKGYLQEKQFSLRRKDGTIIDALITSIARKNKKREIIGYQGSIRDITKQKQVDEEIQRMTAFLDSIVENIPDMIFVKDAAELRFVLFNRAGEELLGYSRDKMLGKNDYDFFTKDQADFFTEKDRDVLHTCRIADIPEEPIQTQDKGVRILHTKKVPILNQRGEPAYLLGISEDITERKQVQETLKENEAKLQTIFNHVGVGIVIIDSNTKVIVEANQAAMKMTGLPKEKIIGQICHSLICHAEIGSCPVKDLGQKMDLSERKLMHADGQQKDILKTVYPITIRGRDCYLESFIDISDRVRTEKLLKESEMRLQRAEKMEALGTLAGGVAHDLNNVLGIIVGYAELLLMNADKSSLIIPQIEAIMKAGQRATAIVDDLLTLARRGVPNRQIINLNNIIAEVKQSPEFKNLLIYHPFVKVNIDFEPDLLNISGSSIHIVKTLLNLILNASEAMAKGGNVTIKTANRYLDKPIQGYDEVREGDYVVLSVSDTGEGLPTADLKRIFEPFYTKKVMGRSGTGLGLAVVWGTVKDHQGYINVQSVEGKGSTFTLYFPVAREDITSDTVAVAASEYMGCGESILVVDDVKEQRDLATSIFGKLNYNVASVSSGEEAIAYIREHHVDLMVLDMIMGPGMDGLDTYKGIIEINPKQRAIIVSGFSESDRVHEAQALGAGTYVKKPYVIEKLGLAAKNELKKPC